MWVLRVVRTQINLAMPTSSDTGSRHRTLRGCIKSLKKQLRSKKPPVRRAYALDHQGRQHSLHESYLWDFGM